MRERALGLLAVVAALAWVTGSARAAVGPDVTRAIEQHDYARAAELLRAEVDRSPDDETVRFKLAEVLAWSKHYDAALAEYDRLLHDHPSNVDYVLGKAQVLTWDARLAEAAAELERARSLAPGYEDVWRLELTVLERGDAARARELRAAAAQRFPQARWWRTPAADPPAGPATQLTAGTEHESLSTNVPDWQRVFVQVDHRRDAGSLYAALSRDQRFGFSDVSLAGGADWGLSARWSAGVDVGWAPGAHFMPRIAVSGRALRSLANGWETEFRLGHRDYRDARVATAGVGFGRYFGDFRAAYRVDLTELDGAASSAAQSVTLNYYRSPRTRFNFSVVAGQEADAVGPDTVLRTDVRGFTVGGRHTLGGHLGLSWWLGSERQGDLYRRDYVGVSVIAGL
jgi:YaiO family outer membrane protein